MGKLLSIDPAPINTPQREFGYDNASPGYALGAAAEEAWFNNPVSAMARGTDLSDAERGQQISRWGGFKTPTSELLDPKTATERYGIPGEIGWTEPVREQAAKLTREWAIERRTVQERLARAQTGVIPSTARFATELLVSAADPINLASAFIPVVGEARYAALVAKLGKPLARVATGAAEGAVGAALVEPIIYTEAQREQQDYDAYDSLLNLSLGAGVGALAHTIGGAAKDILTRRRPTPTPGGGSVTPTQHQAALRAALAAVGDDKPVTSAELLGAIQAFSERERAARQAGRDNLEGSSPTARSSEGVATPDSMNLSPRSVETQDLELGSQRTNEPPPPGDGLNQRMTPSQERGAENASGMDLTSNPKVYHDLNEVKDLRLKAAESLGTLKQVIADVTSEVDGARLEGARLKDEATIQSKIDNGRQPNQISDYVGGRIAVDSWDALNQVVEKLRARGGKLSVDDFLDQPKNGGYRAVHVQMDMGNGLSAEIQIVPSDIVAIQKQGYEIYAKWRRKDLTEAEKQAFAIDQVKSENLFADAWEAWSRRNGMRPGSMKPTPGQAWKAATDAQARAEQPDPIEKAAVAAAAPMEKRMVEPETIDLIAKEADEMAAEVDQELESLRAGGVLTAADEAALESGNTEAKMSQDRATGIRAFGACLLGGG